MHTSISKALPYRVAALVCLAAAVSSAVAAPTVKLERTINNPHPQPRRDFGWSIDTFNDKLLVGSYGGSVYVMNPNTGAQLLRLQSPEQFGSFGRSISQFGNLIAVGANELNFGPHVRVGSAYLFDGTTGAHVRTLRNPNPADFGWFGFSMEDAAGKLFVSSEGASLSDAGRVYVYGPSSSTPIGSLVNPQAATPGAWGFGFSMAEHDGDIFVSAPGAYMGGQETGAVYRYDGNTLARELSIANPNPENGADFGRSLSTNSTQLLVGAFGRTIDGVAGAGGAYLFDSDTGALLRTFVNPEPNEYAFFGASVALVGHFAVIGTPRSPGPSSDLPLYTGAAYVFDVNTGGLVAKINSPSPDQNEEFTNGDGTSMTAIGGLLAIGHGMDNGSLGRVYLFSIPEPTSLVLMLAAFAPLAVTRRCRRS